MSGGPYLMWADGTYAAGHDKWKKHPVLVFPQRVADDLASVLNQIDAAKMKLQNDHQKS